MMVDFFHGWRRKAGCILLVMAATLAGMWIRSLGRIDHIAFCTGRSIYSISSGYRACMICGTIYPSRKDAESIFNASTPPLSFLNLGWVSKPFTTTPSGSFEPWAESDKEWHWQCGRFFIGTYSRTHGGSTTQEGYLYVRWSYLVVPLTLLTAYLFFWPGKRPERQAKTPVN